MSWDGIEGFLGDDASPTRRQRILARDPQTRRIVRQLVDRVYDLRIRRGWTQSDLAEAAGMTQSAVARFEGMWTVPTIPVLARIAEALGAELEVRLVPSGGEGEQQGDERRR